MWNYRFITEIENMKNFNLREKYADFDEFNDIDPIVMNKDWCIIRTSKLIPTLWLMQEAKWKIWSLEPDDENGIEYNLLTFYKPKWKK